MVLALSLVGILHGCSQRAAVNVVERLLTNQLACATLVVGSSVREWRSKLGEPQTVEQLDKGNTFFYWPEHGVAVFCHPLFHQQYAYRKPDEWLITSILIPLTNRIHPQLPPVAPHTRVTFMRTLLTLKEVQEKGLDVLPRIKPHYRGGRLECLEIEKPDSFFGDYD